MNAALKAAYAPPLAKRDITAAFLTTLQTDIGTARTLAGGAVQKSTAKVGVTKSETDLKTALVALLQGVQKAAKQKSTRTGDKTLLKTYAVGQKFYSNRAVLEQTATNFLSSLPAAALPGIDPDAIANIQQALADYKQVQTDQTGAQSGATTDRANLDTAVADIARRRREIQLAADAEWPHTNKVNAGIRAEFKLPPGKALK